jgi:hypothetical protein
MRKYLLNIPITNNGKIADMGIIVVKVGGVKAQAGTLFLTFPVDKTEQPYYYYSAHLFGGEVPP